MKVNDLKAMLDKEIASLVERGMLEDKNPDVMLVMPSGSGNIDGLGYALDRHTVFLKSGL